MEIESDTVAGLRATDVLVDQDDANVFPFLGESVKGRLDGGRFCPAVDDEKVLLRICAGGDMLSIVSSPSCEAINKGSERGLGSTHPDAGEEEPRNRVLGLRQPCRLAPVGGAHVIGQAVARTSSPMTARNCRSLKSACEAISMVGRRGLFV